VSTTLAPNAPADTAAAPAGGGRTKLIGIVLLVVAVAAAGWWFFLRPTPEVAPEPGEVVKLEPIQVNLAGGHYLRLGMALQLTETAHEVDGSKGLDAAIGVFSGLPVGEVNKPETREELRKTLEKELDERYHGDVMAVYFTEFVTQ
jgi:flagellar FliL protein